VPYGADARVRRERRLDPEIAPENYTRRTVGPMTQRQQGGIAIFTIPTLDALT
jgi:hypothetical protein